LLLWLTLPGWPQQPGEGLDPAKTWVFVVGVLEWQRSDVYPSFPKTNRRDTRLALAYGKLGVPSEQIYLLLDRSATGHNIHKNFMEILGKSRPGDTLVLYYAGHGYRQESDQTFWMVPYDGYDVDTLWGLRGIERDIQSHFKGSRVLLSADCCHSGSMWLTAGRNGGEVGYFALTSSTARLSSTGNWTFTDCVLDALAGAPRCDSNQDGVISLGEMAAQVERDMQFAEGQLAGGVGSPGFPPETRWVKNCRPLRQGEGQFVSVYADGAYWKARVVERGAQGVRVHWMGLAQDYPDDWVSPARVTPWTGP
jgi:hypothetical protein